MRVTLTVCIGLLLSGCGYHLVGQGDGSGAIPEDVVSISMRSGDAVATRLAAGLKQQLKQGGESRFDVQRGDAETRAEIGIESVSESFVPSAYDKSGIASQYRMNLSARVRIYRAGKVIWESGILSVSGDVFVAGGPAGIESSRERIRHDLQKEWVLAAAGRIASGF